MVFESIKKLMEVSLVFIKAVYDYDQREGYNINNFNTYGEYPPYGPRL